MGAFSTSDVINGIRWLTEPALYPDSHGDTWTSTWADDGELYALADDTTGIGGSCRSNIAIFRMRGIPPAYTVERVNPMSDYQAYYNPGLPAKWFENDGRVMWMTMAGNWTNAFRQRDDMPFGYGLTVRRLELLLTP